MTRTHRWPTVLATVVLGVTAPAQVVVNEVLFDPTGADLGNEIIEIANVGGAPQDLSGWALCLGFSAPGSRVYWNFPNGASIPAGGFLQVHWMGTGSNTATELFTGTAANNFTCQIPPQTMDNAIGSVALYRSQSCLNFNFAVNIVDFVQWGGGTLRESVAVTAGIWPAGAFVPVFAEGHSIAYDGAGDDPSDYFDDACPTLGSANTGPGVATAVNFGAGCAGSAGVPQFVTSGGPPALGNQSFALNVQNAPAGNLSALFLGVQGSLPIFGCTLLSLPAPTGSVPFSVGPDLPLPIVCDNGLLGASLALQWIILDPGGPRGISMSDGLLLTF